MWSLIQIELYKIFRRPRTYIAFGAIAALIVIIQLGLKIDGDTYAGFLMKDIKDTLTVDGKVLNGYLICYILLQLLLVHVPLLVALIAADMISGEANLGTLRLLFTTPYSRTHWVLAKFIAASMYTILLLIWLASVGPIVGTMSAIVFFTILSTLNIPLFNIVKPYLFTTHMNNWKEFFDIKVNIDNEAIRGSILNIPKIKTSLMVLTLHIILFVTASIIIIKKKDILS